MRERIESDQAALDSDGALRLQLYVVTSTARSLSAVRENAPAHRAYIRSLEERNILFAGGPLWTDDGAYFEGHAMYVYRARSVDAARAIALADPMHSSGARTFEIRPWLLNDGKITISVTLSGPGRDVK